MVRIDEKIRKFQEENPGKKFYSFEFFPPKTDQGLENLYARFDRMTALNPMWIDVTWGAGGSTSERTIEICEHALKVNGLEPMMHLTCTNMHKDMIDNALKRAKELGIQNILALRGDPPASQERWTAAEGGFSYATDLVRYIRKEHGEYFCIAVAGYPEGHPDCDSKEDDMKHLVEKIEAGANLIVTQLFYDTDVLIQFAKDVKALGITAPVLPGMMPILGYGGFKRMTELCKVAVPKELADRVEAVKDDEEALKQVGIEELVKMSEKLIDCDVVPGLHWYTLNLDVPVTKILKELSLTTDEIANGIFKANEARGNKV